MEKILEQEYFTPLKRTFLRYTKILLFLTLPFIDSCLTNSSQLEKAILASFKAPDSSLTTFITNKNQYPPLFEDHTTPLTYVIREKFSKVFLGYSSVESGKESPSFYAKIPPPSDLPPSYL